METQRLGFGNNRIALSSLYNFSTYILTSRDKDYTAYVEELLIGKVGEDRWVLGPEHYNTAL